MHLLSNAAVAAVAHFRVTESSCRTNTSGQDDGSAGLTIDGLFKLNLVLRQYLSVLSKSGEFSQQQRSMVTT